MKILILHQHFKNPENGGAIRSYYLSRALISRGHEVIVLAGHNESFREEVIDGIKVYWLPVKYDNRFGFMSRGFSFVDYVGEVVRRSKVYRNSDLCYAISVPLTTGVAALYLKRFYAIPFLFEVGDLWPDAPVEMGFVKSRLLIRILYWLERKIYRNAATLVSLSPSITQVLERKSPGATIATIPNMADTCFYQPRPERRLTPTPDNPFLISYIGAIGFANGLEHVIECALESQASGLPIQFVICGEGAYLGGLKELSVRHSVRNLRFEPFQNREGVRRLMNNTDAVWVSYRPYPVLETGSPNKYFDGLAGGKLILVNFGGWIREEIEREKCGAYVAPEYAGSFTETIKPFIKNPELLARYQTAARSLAERKYSRKLLSDQFTTAVEQSFNSMSSR